MLVLMNVGLRVGRGSPRTRSSAHAGSGSSQLSTGGINPRLTPIRLPINSTAPQPDARVPMYSLRIEASTGHRVTTRAGAEQLAMNHGPPPQGMLALFQNQDPGTLPGYRPVAPQVKRPASPRGLSPPVRHDMVQVQTDKAQGMDLRVGPTGDHHVGLAASDDPGGLGDRQVGRGITLGDRVARPLAVHEDRDVAGQHVGK